MEDAGGDGEGLKNARMSKASSLELIRAYLSGHGGGLQRQDAAPVEDVRKTEGNVVVPSVAKGNMDVGGAGLMVSAFGSTSNLAQDHVLSPRRGGAVGVGEKPLGRTNDDSSGTTLFGPGSMQVFDDIKRQAMMPCQRQIVPGSLIAVPASAIGAASDRSHGTTSSDAANAHQYPGVARPFHNEEDKKKARKERRMLSNRESARRSRKRKQEHLVELENKVQVMTEEYGILKSQYDALEAKLMKREDEIRRLQIENTRLKSTSK